MPGADALIPHTQIVQSLMAKVRDMYIFPDAGSKICDCLQKHLAA